MDNSHQRLICLALLYLMEQYVTFYLTLHRQTVQAKFINIHRYQRYPRLFTLGTKRGSIHTDGADMTQEESEARQVAPHRRLRVALLILLHLLVRGPVTVPATAADQIVAFAFRLRVWQEVPLLHSSTVHKADVAQVDILNLRFGNTRDGGTEVTRMVGCNIADLYVPQLCLIFLNIILLT